MEGKIRLILDIEMIKREIFEIKYKRLSQNNLKKMSIEQLKDEYNELCDYLDLLEQNDNTG